MEGYSRGNAKPNWPKQQQQQSIRKNFHQSKNFTKQTTAPAGIGAVPKTGGGAGSHYRNSHHFVVGDATEMRGWDDEPSGGYEPCPAEHNYSNNGGGGYDNNNTFGRGGRSMTRGGGGRRHNNHDNVERGGRVYNNGGGRVNNDDEANNYNDDQGGNVGGGDGINSDNNTNIKITSDDEPYKNTIFDFIPHDFKSRTIEELYNKCPQIFRKCNILQKCLLRNYVIKAYKMTLEEHKKAKAIAEHSLATATTTMSSESALALAWPRAEVKPFGSRTHQTLPSTLEEEELEDLQQVRSMQKQPGVSTITSVDLIDLYHSMLQAERSADVQSGDTVRPPPPPPFLSNVENLMTDLILEEKLEEQEKLLRPAPSMEISLSDITSKEQLADSSIRALLTSDVVDVPQIELPRIIQQRPHRKRRLSESLLEEHLLRFPLEMRQFRQIPSTSSLSSLSHTIKCLGYVQMDLKLIEDEFLKCKDGGTIMMSQSEAVRNQDDASILEICQLETSATPVVPPTTTTDTGIVDAADVGVASTTKDDKSIGGIIDSIPHHTNISSIDITRPGTLKDIEEYLSLGAQTLPKTATADDMRQLSESTLKTDLTYKQLITSTPEKAVVLKYATSADVQRPSTISEKSEVELSQDEQQRQQQPQNLIPGTEIPVAEISVTEQGITDMPATELPVTELSAMEGPITDVPAAELPMTTEEPIKEVIAEEQAATSIGAAAQAMAMSQTIPKPPDAVVPLTDDDFRKDWFNILRQREADVNYEIGEFQAKRRKRHRGYRRHPHPHPITQLIQEEKPQQPATAAVSLSPPPSLFGVVPPPTDLENGQQLPPSTTTVTQQQQQEQEEYDQFILNNLESVTQLIYNDALMKDILKGHCDYLQQMKDSEKPIQRYDIEVILNAPKHRLNIKREIIRALICNETFDFSRLDCIKDRMSAAIAFAFLIDLKSVGLITLSKDGRVAGLA